jgi:hypothetical protein
MERPTHHDDILVKRQYIEELFHPRLPRRTFDRKINEGFIVPCEALRGYYLYNETRRRLGLAPLEIDSFRSKYSEQTQLKDPYAMRLAAAIVHVYPDFLETLTDEQLPPALTTEEYGEVAKAGLQLSGFLSRFKGASEKKHNALGIIRNRKFRSAYLPDPG